MNPQPGVRRVVERGTITPSSGAGGAGRYTMQLIEHLSEDATPRTLGGRPYTVDARNAAQWGFGNHSDVVETCFDEGRVCGGCSVVCQEH